MKSKLFNTKELGKVIERIGVMPDEKLLNMYRNIDWEDFRAIDVGVLCGEIEARGYRIDEDKIDEDGNCILEFKPINLEKKDDKVA